MSAISITKLYDLLSSKLGKETAENLTTFIENKINHGLENQSHILATKEDLAKLKEDIADLKEGLAKLDGKIEAKTSETKSAIIRWMFIFWIGQATVIFSFILLFLRK